MLFVAMCMDLLQTKWIKSDKEKQIPIISLMYGNIKNYTNELIYKTETDS